jgi:tRNA(Ile)-lysidine synthase
MLSTILRTIRAHALAQPGDVVIVAVSGGPDSMALLDALGRLGPTLPLALEVATVDHGLRPEARAEAELVRARARALGLPWHGLRVDAAAARRGHASLHDAARRVRLGALEELAGARGAVVALAHQADDQAETVLFRIVRGTGLRGLAGIPYQRGPFIRPLLDVTRAEISRYLARHAIPFVEDPSNADARFARARVRHHLMPLLAAENPRVREALVGLAAAARAGGPPAGGDLPADIGRRAAAVVAGLRARGGSARVDVSRRRVVEVAYGQVRVGQRGMAGPEGRARPEPVVVEGAGTYELAGAPSALRVSVGGDGAAAGVVPFDADALDWPLVVRARRPGDRMRPRGGRGSRKLSDLLIDAKVPRGARDRLPVLATAGDVVLFVPGLRPAEEARPSPATRRYLNVTVVPRSAGTAVASVLDSAQS